MAMKLTKFRSWSLTALLGSLFLCGCSDESSNSDTLTASSAAENNDSVGTEEDAPEMGDAAAEESAKAKSAAPDSSSSAQPVADAAATGDGSVALSAANTKVQFVGVHLGDKPDPRTGSFSNITGTAKVDGGVLRSLTVEFDTASLTTEFDKLTDHLKSPDFFDVKQHPVATFVSTAIEVGADGKSTVTGDLTLLGVTKSVSFPATITTEGGLKLNAQLSIDRTEFGMSYGSDKVEKMVALTVAIGG